MHALAQLVLLSTILSSNKAYFLHGQDGYPNLRYHYHDSPPPPHPLDEPPPHPLPLQHLPPLYSDSQPLLYRAPPPSAVVVVPVRGVFPPFIERIVQRIQTFWSVYNPPALLTRPPPDPPTTTKRPRTKATTTTKASTLLATTASTTSDSPGDITSSSEDSTTKVSTLVVFEVTPSPAAAAGAKAESEDSQFITPERASALGQKEAYLRFLQTGRVPPFLQPDTADEMPDEEMYT